VEYFIAWFMASLLVGIFASVRRNRNGFGWFLLSFAVFTPLFAGILVAIMRERQGPIIITAEQLKRFAEAAAQARPIN
jgi:hypothetical protein